MAIIFGVLRFLGGPEAVGIALLACGIPVLAAIVEAIAQAGDGAEGGVGAHFMNLRYQNLLDFIPLSQVMLGAKDLYIICHKR